MKQSEYRIKIFRWETNMDKLIRIFIAILCIPFGFLIASFIIAFLPFAILFGTVTINDVPLKEWIKETFH